MRGSIRILDHSIPRPVMSISIQSQPCAPEALYIFACSLHGLLNNLRVIADLTCAPFSVCNSALSLSSRSRKAHHQRIISYQPPRKGGSKQTRVIYHWTFSYFLKSLSKTLHDGNDGILISRITYLKVPEGKCLYMFSLLF